MWDSLSVGGRWKFLPQIIKKLHICKYKLQITIF